LCGYPSLYAAREPFEEMAEQVVLVRLSRRTATGGLDGLEA